MSTATVTAARRVRGPSRKILDAKPTKADQRKLAELAATAEAIDETLAAHRALVAKRRRLLHATRHLPVSVVADLSTVEISAVSRDRRALG